MNEEEKIKSRINKKVNEVEKLYQLRENKIDTLHKKLEHENAELLEAQDAARRLPEALPAPRAWRAAEVPTPPGVLSINGTMACLRFSGSPPRACA